MPGIEDTDLHEAPGAEEWVPLSYFEDRITAGMTATYLEAANIEARMTQEGGQYCIAVPGHQYDRATEVCDPMHPAGGPLLQDSGSNTGIHNVLKEQYARVEAKSRDRHRRSVMSRVFFLMLLAAAVAIALFFLV